MPFFDGSNFMELGEKNPPIAVVLPPSERGACACSREADDPQTAEEAWDVVTLGANARVKYER